MMTMIHCHDSPRKKYGLYGLKHHILEMREDATRILRGLDDKQTREDTATQPLDCWKVEFCNIRLSSQGILSNKIMEPVNTRPTKSLDYR